MQEDSRLAGHHAPKQSVVLSGNLSLAKGVLDRFAELGEGAKTVLQLDAQHVTTSVMSTIPVLVDQQGMAGVVLDGVVAVSLPGVHSISQPNEQAGALLDTPVTTTPQGGG